MKLLLQRSENRAEPFLKPFLRPVCQGEVSEGRCETWLEWVGKPFVIWPNITLCNEITYIYGTETVTSTSTYPSQADSSEMSTAEQAKQSSQGQFSKGKWNRNRIGISGATFVSEFETEPGIKWVGEPLDIWLDLCKIFNVRSIRILCFIHC